jgi:hypothetical protein
MMLTCSNCGKDGDNLKTCSPCKLVKHCDVTCQRAHWPRHKKECKKRAAELHDEALFKEPPPNDECPICMQTLPVDVSLQMYQMLRKGYMLWMYIWPCENSDRGKRQKSRALSFL